MAFHSFNRVTYVSSCASASGGAVARDDPAIAVDGDRRPLAHLDVADARRAAAVDDRDVADAAHGGPAHAARDDGGVAGAAAAAGDDRDAGDEALHVRRGGRRADEHDLPAVVGHRLGAGRVERGLADGAAGRRREPAGEHVRVGRGGGEARRARRVELLVGHALGRVGLGDEPLVDHVDGDPHRGAPAALGDAGLQHPELAELDRELHLDEVARLALERDHDLLELAPELRQARGQRLERLRVADAGDDVLALGVVEDLAVGPGRARRRVAREGDAAARRLGAVPVAEHHRLHDARGADRVVDSAELPVGLRARAVPRAEDGVDALLDLRARLLRELAAALLADEREQRLRALAGGVARRQPGRRRVEQGLLDDAGRDPPDGGRERVEQALVRPPRELVVARVACEALDHLVVEPDVEDGVHHAGHRDRRARSHRDEQRRVGVAEPALERVLEAAQLALGVGEDGLGEPAVAQVAAADVGAEDEARRHGEPEADHLDEARALAAEARGVGVAGGAEGDDVRKRGRGGHQ